MSLTSSIPRLLITLLCGLPLQWCCCGLDTGLGMGFGAVLHVANEGPQRPDGHGHSHHHGTDPLDTPTHVPSDGCCGHVHKDVTRPADPDRVPAPVVAAVGVPLPALPCDADSLVGGQAVAPVVAASPGRPPTSLLCLHCALVV